MAVGSHALPHRIGSLCADHYSVGGDVQKLGHLQCGHWVVYFLSLLALGDQTHLEPNSRTLWSQKTMVFEHAVYPVPGIFGCRTDYR